MQGNPILEKTLQFALDIIEFTELLESRRKFVLGTQLLKSGTAVGANVREAQSAESKADFIHKMKVADKEALETDYWLTLCQLSKAYPDCPELIGQVREIRKILSKIIASAKQ